MRLSAFEDSATNDDDYDDDNDEEVTSCFTVDNEDQQKARKRVSQLSQSDLLAQNNDGDSYVFITVILL